MIQRSLAKKRSGEGGFTLIELLIVIVILGILAAIVVLAIGGLSGKSKQSACSAEAKTIITAEDSFFASPGDAAGNPDATGGANTNYTSLDNLYTQHLLKGTAPTTAVWTLTLGNPANTYTLAPTAAGHCSGVTGPEAGGNWNQNS